MSDTPFYDPITRKRFSVICRVISIACLSFTSVGALIGLSGNAVVFVFAIIAGAIGLVCHLFYLILSLKRQDENIK